MQNSGWTEVDPQPDTFVSGISSLRSFIGRSLGSRSKAELAIKCTFCNEKHGMQKKIFYW